METGIIISIVLGVLLLISVYGIINLLRKIEIMEDNSNELKEYNDKLNEFILLQSKAITASNKRLNEIDEKGFFRADDEIGWFFQQLRELQDNLNQFRVMK